MLFLRQRLRAGILLYALFLSLAFGMVLQFYVSRQLARERLYQAQLALAKAQLMGEMTRQVVKQDSGQLVFDQGTSHYRQEGDTLQVTMFLADGSHYQEVFYHPQEALVSDPEKASGADKQEAKSSRLDLVPPSEEVEEDGVAQSLPTLEEESPVLAEDEIGVELLDDSLEEAVLDDGA